jgi:hypothetical protein
LFIVVHIELHKAVDDRLDTGVVIELDLEAVNRVIQGFNVFGRASFDLRLDETVADLHHVDALEVLSRHHRFHLLLVTVSGVELATFSDPEREVVEALDSELFLFQFLPALDYLRRELLFIHLVKVAVADLLLDTLERDEIFLL